MLRTAALVAALAGLAAVIAVSCSKSKSAGSKDSSKASNVPGGGTQEIIPPPGGGMAKGGDDDAKLKPDEGSLAVEVPADAVAGKETTARILVTPTDKYKINFEYPTKLTLKSPADVTIAKAELKAGGPSKAQGDAEKFEEKQLAFAVKLTPTKSGTHTISGTFRFAVCDKEACLAKTEPISIQLAAK